MDGLIKFPLCFATVWLVKYFLACFHGEWTLDIELHKSSGLGTSIPRMPQMALALLDSYQNQVLPVNVIALSCFLFFTEFKDKCWTFLNNRIVFAMNIFFFNFIKNIKICILWYSEWFSLNKMNDDWEKKCSLILAVKISFQQLNNMKCLFVLRKNDTKTKMKLLLHLHRNPWSGSFAKFI